ncbi:MAG TPA: glycosyltransferase [Panacibacter sp.]|nr:glycosyltransferase [Panacibacter sp.]
MRILIVGSLSNYAIERFFLKHLNSGIDDNTECKVFAAQDLFLNYYNKQLLNKVIFRLGYKKIYDKINTQLKKEIELYKPDIIWIFKGMEIYPETLKWAKNKNTKLVNYNPDNPFLFSGKGSGNSNITKSIRLYDLHLTYSSEVKVEIESKYSIPVAILPFGFEVGEDIYERCRSMKEIKKLCFVGNPDKYRADFLVNLAGHDISIDVYGNNWSKFIDHPNIKVHGMVTGVDFWFTLYKYRIQLNLMRPHNLHTHNMRSFEIPGVGGIQLAPDTYDHKTYFDPDKEIFIYQNLSTCVEQINKILLLTESEANQRREYARYRSMQSGYSYKSRTEQALKEIKSVCEYGNG